MVVESEVQGIEKLFENYTEVPKPSEATIEGSIPKWLDVTLLRNGPGMFKIGDTEYKHWFDGLAFIQRYFFNDGKMYYSAKYLESETKKLNMAANRIVISEFGTSGFPDPCKSIFGRLQTFFSEEHITDNASVNFFAVGDTVWAASETPKITQIDKETLDTIGKFDLTKYLVLNTFTAHQQFDADNNIYHIGIRFAKHTEYVISKTTNPKNEAKKATEALAETVIVATIPSTFARSPSYFHSFAMSDNYCVLFESPLVLNIMQLIMRKIIYRSYRETMFWKEDTPVFIRVINKNTGKEVELKFRHDPFFSFHQANAFEQDGCVVVDYVAMKKAGTLTQFTLEELRNKGLVQNINDEAAYCYRMVIPVDVDLENVEDGDDLLKGKKIAGKCEAIYKKTGEIWLKHEKLSDYAFEFPRINFNYNLKPHRFIYGAGLQWNQNNLVGLTKVDVQTRKTITWNRDNLEQIAAEPIFVPKPDGQLEDDGVILAPVMTFGNGGKPYVLVLDAKTMTELARCYVEHRLPIGFHAQVYSN